MTSYNLYILCPSKFKTDRQEQPLLTLMGSLFRLRHHYQGSRREVEDGGRRLQNLPCNYGGVCLNNLFCAKKTSNHDTFGNELTDKGKTLLEQRFRKEIRSGKVALLLRFPAQG